MINSNAMNSSSESTHKKTNPNDVFKEDGALNADAIHALVGRDDPIILEIGANNGNTTLEMLRAMPNAKIYAFEPDPRAIKHFKASVTSQNVRLFECAVGGHNGSTVFHQSTGEGKYEDWNLSGSIRTPKSHLQAWPAVKFERDITVPMVCLDDWAKSVGVMDVDFIWADVQGAESDLVVGGLAILERTRFFYTEYSDTEWYEGQITLRDLDALLPDFSILRLFRFDVLFENVRMRSRDPGLNHILGEFGISQEFLERHIEGRLPQIGYRQSTIAEIRNVITSCVPKNGGHALVRLGGVADGGYLIPDDLKGIEACFSPGVSNFKDFEDALANAYGIKAFMCDYSSDVDRFKTPLKEGMQFFSKKWLDVVPGENNIDIDDWVAHCAPGDGDLICQMDIEGAEYRNILKASMHTLSRFRIFVLEIHGLNNLRNSAFLNDVFAPVISKLSANFTCVHAHANNFCGYAQFADDLKVPNVLELTFLRNDRLRKPNAPLVIPHQLDAVNMVSHPPLLLEGIWLENADLQLSRVNGLTQKVAWLEGRLCSINEIVRNSEADLLSSSRQIYQLTLKSLDPDNNVARGKAASQSTVSEWSTMEGAGGAINGKKTGEFGFHTQLEDRPWWTVDLGESFEISAILVFNRLDACSDRVRALRVLVSTDAGHWTLIYDHAGRPPFGGINFLEGRPPLLISLPGVRARFVRIECVDRTFLHLDEVEIYRSDTRPIR
jgi:FkbM family methyltransferase